MSMKTKTTLVIFFLLAAVLAFGDDQHLKQLFDLTLQKSPALAAMSSEVRAAEAEARSLMPLMDPMVSFEYMELPLVAPDMGGGPMSEKKFSLTQTIPFPGKLAAQAAVRNRAWQAARLQFEAEYNRMKKDIALMYFRITAMDKLIGLADEKGAQLDILLAAVNAKFRTGQASYADYTKAKIMKSMVQNNATAMRADRTVMLTSLARMVGVGALPSEVAFTFGPVPENSVLPENELVARALASFPESVLGSVLVEKAEMEAAAAAWDLAPDTTLGLSLNLPDSGGTYLSFMAGISLPLYFFGKQVPEIQMTAAMRQAGAERLTETQNALVENIRNSLTLIRSNREILREIEDTVIREARASLDVSLREYAAGKRDVRSLLDEMTVLYDYLAESEMAREKLLDNLSLLDYYTGFTLRQDARKGN
jgi:cobalt-zinc-cadmium efflux system outer membrane protein